MRKFIKGLSVSTLAFAACWLVYIGQIWFFINGLPPIMGLQGLTVWQGILLFLPFLLNIPFLVLIRNVTRYIILWGVFLTVLTVELVVLGMNIDLVKSSISIYDAMEPTYEEQKRNWK